MDMIKKFIVVLIFCFICWFVCMVFAAKRKKNNIKWYFTLTAIFCIILFANCWITFVCMWAGTVLLFWYWLCKFYRCCWRFLRVEIIWCLSCVYDDSLFFLFMFLWWAVAFVVWVECCLHWSCMSYCIAFWLVLTETNGSVILISVDRFRII